jgi:hypothetical protein
MRKRIADSAAISAPPPTSFRSARTPSPTSSGSPPFRKGTRLGGTAPTPKWHLVHPLKQLKKTCGEGEPHCSRSDDKEPLSIYP